MQALKVVAAIAVFYGMANAVVWAISMCCLALGYSAEAGALQGLLPLLHGQSMP